MGIITKGMGAVLKHIKKSGRSITKAGDKWHAKTQKLQSSKKKIEKIKGAARIIVPMTGAAVAGGALGVKDAKEEIRKRGVYGVERKRIRPKSIKNLPHDVKEQFKMIKEKFKKK